MAEFLQHLDPSKLVLVETALSLAISTFKAPVYNLPIFLFGTYVAENIEAVQSLQTFVGITAVSIVLDIIYMSTHHQNWFIRLITIVILILKLPTFFVFGQALRQRGPVLGIHGGDLSGPTVWSMPGGFTSGGREGYQTVDEEPRVPPQRSAVPPPAPAADRSAPGAYQSV